MAPKTAAPRTEKGYVNPIPGTLTAWGLPMLDQFENNPDLTWPNSVWTYGRMVREDARIASVLRALGLPIRRTPWRIRQNGASDEVTEHVAVSMGLPIEGDDEDRPTPRMKAVRVEFVPREASSVTLGDSWATDRMSCAPIASSSVPETAVTAIGTSMSDSSRRRAVTVITSAGADACVSCAIAPGAVTMAAAATLDSSVACRVSLRVVVMVYSPRNWLGF